MSLRRLLALGRKELLQLRRDRLTLAMMVLLPIMQLMLFGFAINTDVRNVPMVVYDLDHSRASRELVLELETTGYLRSVGAVRSYGELEQQLRAGQARVALAIPEGFSSHQKLGRTATVQLVVDGSDPQIVASANSATSGLVAVTSQQLLIRRLRQQGTALNPVPLTLESTVWYNPDLRTAVAIVPGLIGVLLTMTMVMLTSMAVTRERERGTLEQLIVSPLSRSEMVLGKILPYIAIGYVQMTIILLVGRAVFDVPVRGSVALLYGMSFLFIAASLAVGLLFSTLAKTQQQAMQMSFFFLLPNILLSGFMFPFEGMPRPFQLLSEALPLTHYLRIVRGVALKGATFADLQGQLLQLAVIFLVLITLSALRLKKQLA